ncbi:SpoIIE family protein phosphatase [Sulfidibacter corallicola]|uniref:SpoIIE family protein phosphatase n=1 Tax=Sulfidibacter corallicola TaxID=2818388 RepID=A0A8A4TSZ6_SULCO|nr:SpoIIE family protein phosphatase [Sulfidibacter corallicola]QTD52172.1 SpoIIE family protein phosphatase [Sulfidibacter corallicola]
MKSPTQRLWTFWISFSLLVLFLLPVALKNTYNKLNSGIDHNLFAMALGRIMVTAPVQAKARQSSLELFGAEHSKGIQVGDLLLSVNGERVKTSRDAYFALAKLKSWQIVRLNIQRTRKYRYVVAFDARVGDLPREFIRDIPPSVYVYHILEGGASDRAGIQTGDLIHRINGEEIRDEAHADFLVRRTLAGEVVDYDLLRGLDPFTAQVKMARLNIVFSDILFFLCGFAWIAAGLLLAFWRGRLRAARPLAFGFFLIGFSLLLFPSRDHLDHGFLRSLRRLTLWPAFYLGIAALFHASYYFPRERRDMLRVTLLRYICYPIAVIAAAVAVARWNLETLLFTLPAMFLLHLAVRFWFRSGSTSEHARLEAPIVWTGLTGAGLVFFAVSWGRGLPREILVLLPVLVSVALLGAYLYTIGRHRLLGVSIGLVTQYSLMATLWMGLVVLGFGSVLNWFAAGMVDLPNVRLTSSFIEVTDEPVSLGVQSHGRNLILMFFAITLSALFFYVGRLGLAGIRRRFHRTDYNLHKAASDLSELMTRVVSLEELTCGMVSRMAEHMNVKRMGLLVYRDEGHLACLQSIGLARDAALDLPEAEYRSLHQALRTCRSELCVDYLDAAVKQRLTDQGFKYVFPIHSKERFLGCVVVGEKRSEATYRPRDFSFLSTTARQAAVAIENAFLYEQVSVQERWKHELALARQIQVSSLPQQEPEVVGLDVAGASHPAHEVGGDYYGYFQEGDSVLSVFVGDVSGKGTSAALYMSKLQGVLATLATETLSPREMFDKANPILSRELDKGSFISALGVRFDSVTRRFTVARAGHQPLLWYRAQFNEVVQIKPDGLALGLDHGPLFDQVMTEKFGHYSVDDVFLLISDGIDEASDREHQTFGLDRVMHILKHHHDLRASEMRDLILSEVEQFAGGLDRADDQTVVVVRATGVSKTEEAPTHVGVDAAVSDGQ